MSDTSRSSKLPNLGKIGEARLDLVPSLSDCRPGIQPTEYNVVVAPATVQKNKEGAATAGARGLILMPDEVTDTTAMAMQIGRIVSMSPVAFNYAEWPSQAAKPKIGQIIWFARYAGALFEGMDGREYRILKDKDIGAVVEEPRALEAVA